MYNWRNKVKKVLLTEEEINIIGQLFDIAIKAGGLQVAEAAVVLFKKFQDAKEIEEVQ